MDSQKVAPAAKVLFVFGSTPQARHYEMAHLLHASGKYDVRFAYWERRDSSITLEPPPAEQTIPTANLIPIHLPDPRNGALRRLISTLLFSLKLRRVIRDFKPDLIYSININIVGGVKLAQLGMKQISQIHEFQDQFGYRLSKFVRMIYRWCAGEVRHTIIQSEASFAYIERNNLKRCSEPHTVIPPVPLNWQILKRAANHPRSEQLTIGFIGFIQGKKTLPNIVEAVADLVRGGRNIRLLFAGTGPELGLTTELATKHDFIDNIGRYEYYGEYPQLFRRVDLMCAVYPTERLNNRYSIGRRLMECVAVGKPAIVQKDTHMAELVERHGGGWVVDDKNKDAFADIFRRIYDDRELLNNCRADETFVRLARLENYRETFLKVVAGVISS